MPDPGQENYMDLQPHLLPSIILSGRFCDFYSPFEEEDAVFGEMKLASVKQLSHLQVEAELRLNHGGN